MTHDATPAADVRDRYLPESAMAARSGQVPSLDGLRAVSVMIVLCSHFISSKVFPGSLGVYIFFVISGFLITRLLLAEQKRSGSISLVGFYSRRAVRLYPVALLYTAAVVCAYLIQGLAIDWKQPLGVLFYFINYVYAPLDRVGHPPGIMPFEPLWSLSVEEHFYLGFPALVLLLRRNPLKLLIAMGVVCVFCLTYRLGWALARPDWLETRFFYIRSECRLDSMAFGVAIACLCEMPKGRALLQRLASPVVLWGSAAVLVATLLFRDGFFRETIRYSLQGFFIATAVAAILFRPGFVPAILNTAPFVFVGKISYSLYVWSICSIAIVHAVLPGGGLLQRGLFFGVAFACACASYFLLEKPLLSLRKKLGSLADLKRDTAPKGSAPPGERAAADVGA